MGRPSRRVTTAAALAFLLLLSLPLAAAYTGGYTGISPMNYIVEWIASIFNVPALQGEWVQEGVVRLALFLVFLAVAHWVFKRRFDNKTSARSWR